MKKKVWLAVASAVVVIAVIVGVVVLIVGRSDTVEEELPETQELSQVGKAVVGEGIVDNGQLELEDDPDFAAGMDRPYVVNMAESTWRFKDGKSPSYDAEIDIDTANEEPVYLELMFADESETLFRSEIYQPGDRVSGITLGKELEKGEYDCILVYHLMDSEMKEETGTVTLAITVIVEN